MPRGSYIAATLAAAAITAMATGCGSDTDPSTSSASSDPATSNSTDQPVKVAYLSYALTDYVRAEEKGVKSVVEPDGGTVTMFNANFDPTKQTEQCQDAVNSRRYNAIVLASVSPPTGVPCVAVAKAAGIPVATIEGQTGQSNDDIQPQVDGVVGVDTLPVSTAAKRMAEITTKACAGIDPCDIIAEVATPNDPLTNAIVDEIEKTVPAAHVVQSIVGQYDPSVIAKAFPDALNAHPDADVFVAAADSQALAVIPALKQAGKLGEVKIIGNGGSRLGADAIADGTMFGTLGTWPQQDGAIVAKMLTQAVNGDPVEPSAVDSMTVDDPVIVTKDNVDQFKPEWGTDRAGG